MMEGGEREREAGEGGEADGERERADAQESERR